MVPFSASILLVAALCLTAASAVPPRQPAVGHEQLAVAFVHAVANLDFIAASQLYADISTQGHMDACAFKIAAAIKNVVESADYETLSEDDQQQLEALKNQLPTSVRNAVFASSVCLFNVDKQEYLYSPSNDFLNSADSRNVFLWRLGTVVEGSVWILNETLTPGDLKVINVYGEFLYADNSFYYLNRRNIYTYVKSVWTGFSTNVWRFIPNGDEIIIQNTWYSADAGSNETEYLYSAANIYNYDNNRRRVFDWNNAWTVGDHAHRWRIMDCPQL